MRLLPFTLVLAGLFIVITGQLTWTNGLVGLIVGAAVARGCNLGATSSMRRLRQWMAVPWLAFGTLLELGRGSWLMLQTLVGWRDWRCVGFVVVPTAERTLPGSVFTSLVATATPGSVLVALDWRATRMLLNVIDASKPHTTRATLQTFYRRYQRYVVP